MSKETVIPAQQAGRVLTDADILAADLCEIRATVDELAAAVAAASADLDMGAVHEPFVAGLLAQRREPMPARESVGTSHRYQKTSVHPLTHQYSPPAAHALQ